MYQVGNNRKEMLELKKKPIGSLADIMVGLVLKRKVAEITDLQTYKYKALTLKSFNSEGWIDTNFLDDFVSSEKLDDRYLCFKDDVVIKITPPYTAVTITDDTDGCVVPSQFIILRIEKKLMNPEYLSLFLNSDNAKKHIAITATGVTVPMLKTGTLKELEIPIVEFERQENIAEINKLIIKERHLLYKLISEKEKYYQALTEVLISEEKENE